MERIRDAVGAFFLEMYRWESMAKDLTAQCVAGDISKEELCEILHQEQLRIFEEHCAAPAKPDFPPGFSPDSTYTFSRQPITKIEMPSKRRANVYTEVDNDPCTQFVYQMKLVDDEWKIAKRSFLNVDGKLTSFYF